MQKIEAVQFEDFFEKRLQKYNVDKETVSTEEAEQEAIAQRLREANGTFTTTRRGDSSTKDREKALQSLENAFFKYKEIISNLDAGRKFYNDLAKIVSRFRDDCRNFAYQRRSEASHMEADMTTAMASLSLNQQHLEQQRRADQHNPPYTEPAHTEAPLAAPLPTRAAPIASPGMWTPDMAIKFGGPENGQAPNQAKNATWDPARGMRFS